ncbi:hypothetical protein Q5752_001341 [Cryptotrichosporon argae]
MPNLLRGTVTKVGAMRKTITVTIARKFEHPKLLKPVVRTKKMLVHDEDERAQLNDRVTIVHGKPVSSAKHFRLQSIDKRGADLARSAGEGSGAGVDAALAEQRTNVLDELSAKAERRQRGETEDGA